MDIYEFASGILRAVVLAAWFITAAVWVSIIMKIQRLEKLKHKNKKRKE